MRILVADDDASIRAALHDFLREDGHDVVTAANGVQAKAWFEAGLRRPERMPDVMILDVHMPGMSGPQLLASVRLARLALPVILMTALPDRTIREVARALEVTALLGKPFEIDDLRRVLRAVDVDVDARRHA